MTKKSADIKHVFFAVIQAFAGSNAAEALTVDEVVSHFSKKHGRSPHTIRDWLKEIQGQVTIRRGVIAVPPDVDFSGHETIVRPTRQETANGHKSAIRGQRAHHGPRARHRGQQ